MLTFAAYLLLTSFKLTELGGEVVKPVQLIQ